MKYIVVRKESGKVIEVQETDLLQSVENYIALWGKDNVIVYGRLDYLESDGCPFCDS